MQKAQATQQALVNAAKLRGQIAEKDVVHL